MSKKESNKIKTDKVTGTVYVFHKEAWHLVFPLTWLIVLIYVLDVLFNSVKTNLPEIKKKQEGMAQLFFKKYENKIITLCKNSMV